MDISGTPGEDNPINRDIVVEAQNSGAFIASVSFLEDGFELTVIEESKQSEKFASMETLMIRADNLEQQTIYAQIQSMLNNLINEAYADHRAGN